MNVKRTSSAMWSQEWTREATIQLDYCFAPLDKKSVWRSGSRADFEYRDLGLSAASGGKLSALSVRRNSTGSASSDWHYHELAFQFALVLHGSISIETERGHPTTLGRGGAVFLPPLVEHRSDVSHDYAAIEITSPADVVTGEGYEGNQKADRGTVAKSHDSPLYEVDDVSKWKRGAGPRDYFEYRNLPIAERTDGRLHIHLLRAAEDSPAGGTGWHYHTMSQIFIVLSGSAKVAVADQTTTEMHHGDAMTIAAGMRHNVLEFSRDYEILEICIPALYETVATDAPNVPVE
jgi:quercetin dioxygenase-like cupin family protein